MTQSAVIFINAPFCIKPQPYLPSDVFAASGSMQDRYLKALRDEIDGALPMLQDYSVTAIYLGGGCPSVMNPDKVAKLLSYIRANVNLDKAFELTMETIPQTAGTPSMTGMKRGGVNRVSMLLPAAADEDLVDGTYGYSSDDLNCCLGYLGRFTFGSVDIRIPVGYKGQDVEHARRTVKAVCAFSPAHITLVPFSEATEQTRELVESCAELLDHAGYKRYTTTRFTKNGSTCRFETERLAGCDVFGFGLGARSIMGDMVCTNTTDLNCYLENSDCYDKIVAKVERLDAEARQDYLDVCKRELR